MKHKILHTSIFSITLIALIGANSVASYFQHQITEILEPSTTIEVGNTDSKIVSENICEEGAVLLKNSKNILPLNNVKSINLFGYGSTALVFGGSGSGAVNTKECTTLIEALNDRGISHNEELTNQYKLWAKKEGLPEDGSRKSTPIYNTDWSLKEPGVTSSIYRESNLDDCFSFSEYAIFSLGRVSGEGTDLPKGENGDGSQDYLALSDVELKVISKLYDAFGDKLIILSNSANPLELAPLDDIGISTIISLPAPGQYGFNSLADLLKGKNKDNEEISFSGRLSSLHAKDHSFNPTHYYSSNLGTHKYSGGSNKGYVDYIEGIYVGYRFFETKALEEGEEWYKDTVQYPFGYGLSYTKFEQKITGINLSTINKETKLSDEIEVTVNVRNVGTYTGKDAIQLYVTKPYKTDGIEKSALDLVEFGKTSSLAPNEAENYVLKVPVKEFSSFDYNDANENNFKGYEIEKGNYELSLRNNSHDIIKTNNVTQVKNLKVNEDLTYENDEKTGYKIEPLFEFAQGKNEGFSYLSRNNLERPNYESKSRNASKDVIDNEVSKLNMKFLKNDEDVYGSVMPTTEANTSYEFKWNYTPEQIEENELKPELNANGSNYINAKKTIVEWNKLNYDDPLWDKLLDQMSANDYKTLVNGGGYQTAAIASINKSLTKDVDGPQGLKLDQGGVGTNSSFGTAYPCEVVVAQTFNKNLAYTYGSSIAKEGISSKITGWYGPGMNIHRSPYEGRYYEYLSEDPVLSGYMAAYLVKGSLEEGMRPYIKHFALNEQENNRDDVVTWANEQAMREIYLKPFEFAVKIGKANCVMSSFNDIGPVWAGACKELLTDLLRKEWGFEGFVLSDYYASWMPADAAIRAGNDCMLSPTQNSNLSYNKSDVGKVSASRNASKNILFAISRQVKSVTIESRDGYPTWVIIGIGIDTTLSIALAFYLFVIFKPNKKKIKES